MSDRLHAIPEAGFFEDIAALSKAIEERKAAQRAGAASLVIKNNSTAVTWDVNAVAVPANSQVKYQVKFTPSTAKNVYASISYVRNVSGGTGAETVNFYPDPANSTLATSRSWVFVINTAANAVTLSLKFFVRSVDTGAISVVAI